MEVSNFDTNRWNERAPGIHHYITRQEAVQHVKKAPPGDLAPAGQG